MGMEGLEGGIYYIFLKPWREALEDPARAQGSLLEKLLEGYRKTRYGEEKGALEVSGPGDFHLFPKTSYQGLRPYLEEVMRGDYEALLPEPPREWVMTRGSTGRSKIIPVTETHLQEVRRCGARAFLNYMAGTRVINVK